MADDFCFALDWGYLCFYPFYLANKDEETLKTAGR